MKVENLSKAAVEQLANAARAGQTLMREAFGLDVRPTGHWGGYTQKLFATLSNVQQQQVTKVVSAYNADVSTIAEIARDASVRKAEVPKLGEQPVTGKGKAFFESTVIPTVVRVAKQMGFRNPTLAAAQLAHESNFGASLSGKFNYAGIKATAAEQATLQNTFEYEGGRKISIKARFKDYASLEDFANDFLKALTRKWPLTLSATNGNEWANALVANPKMKYYTDSPARYASALNRWVGQIA